MSSPPVESEGEQDEFMTPEAFKKWRKSLNLKQKDAADMLGLKKRIIQYYEKGRRDGKRVVIPRTVRLACHAVTQGVRDFNGSDVVVDTGGADHSVAVGISASKAGSPATGKK